MINPTIIKENVKPLKTTLCLVEIQFLEITVVIMTREAKVLKNDC